MGLDIHYSGEKRVGEHWKDICPTSEKTYMECPFCHPDPNPNATFFWLMTDLFPGRGWPSDASENVENEYRYWKSHGSMLFSTFFTLSDVMSVLPTLMSGKIPTATLPAGKGIDFWLHGKKPTVDLAQILSITAYLIQQGPPEDVRVVAFFE